MPGIDELSCTLRELLPELARFGTFNMLLSNGQALWAHASTTLWSIERRHPFGAATLADLETLRELCVMVQETSLCGLGQNAPNPVVSTLRYFYDEYEAHIRKHKCAAGVCALNEKPMSPAVVAPPRPKRKVARLDELEAV